LRCSPMSLGSDDLSPPVRQRYFSGRQCATEGPLHLVTLPRKHFAAIDPTHFTCAHAKMDHGPSPSVLQ
jgi:hypothetical protein